MASGASAPIRTERLEKRVQRRDGQAVLVERLAETGRIRIGFTGEKKRREGDGGSGPRQPGNLGG